MKFSFDTLWQHVIAQFHGSEYSQHGPDHWRRVERNGRFLATRTGADVTIVRLFALFHDSRRENDCNDPGHGARGAEFAASLRGKLFDLSDSAFAQLHTACTLHTDQKTHEDRTIGTCWDADRLDLGRVGIVPSPNYMATEFGKEIAEAGSIYPFLKKCEDQALIAELFPSPPNRK